MTEPPCSNVNPVCVLGMHRSGTSALTRVLNLLGVHLGRHLLKPSRANPKGFWENSRIVACQTELLYVLDSFYDDILPLPDGWESRPEVQPYVQELSKLVNKEFRGRKLWGFKDPRTCRLLPVWTRVFRDLALDAAFVIAIRDLDGVAQSLSVRNGFSFNHSLLMSIEHNLQSELHTRGRRRVVVKYDQLMSDWRTQAVRIGRALRIEWPNSCDAIAAQVATFLDTGLRHHRGDGPKSAHEAVRMRGADPQVARWAFAVQDILSAAAENNAEPNGPALDAVRDEIRAEIPRLAAWRTQRPLKVKLIKPRVWQARQDAEIQRLARENDQLRQQLARARPPAGDLLNLQK
jgi:hypothetical protein